MTSVRTIGQAQPDQRDLQPHEIDCTSLGIQIKRGMETTYLFTEKVLFQRVGGRELCDPRCSLTDMKLKLHKMT